MTLGCGLNVCKWILGFFNFLIFVCGGTILGIGIWIVVDTKSILKVLKASEEISDKPELKDFTTSAFLHQAAYILIAAGAIVFLLGFLGCCGACQESKCMLATYAVFLSIFLIVEIAAVIFAAVSKKDFDKGIQAALLESLKLYGKNEGDTITVGWDKIFQQWSCCGVNGPGDMKDTEWHSKNLLLQVPASCCKDETIAATCPATGIGKFNDGCYEAFENFVNKHEKVIIGVGVGVALVQLLAIIFACCVCCAIKG